MPEARGPHRDLRKLADWIRYCESVGDAPRDGRVAGGGWIVSGSTPPPTLDDPLARIPLERARAARQRARETGDSEDRESSLREALDWTSHPHPASSDALRRRLEAERREIRELLEMAGT